MEFKSMPRRKIAKALVETSETSFYENENKEASHPE